MKILLIAAAAISTLAFASELRAANPGHEIVLKSAEKLDLENLPIAETVYIVGEHPEIAAAYEAIDGVTVVLKPAPEAATPEAAPAIHKMTADQLRAFLDDSGVPYETDDNKPRLRELAESVLATKAAA